LAGSLLERMSMQIADGRRAENWTRKIPTVTPLHHQYNMSERQRSSANAKKNDEVVSPVGLMFFR
jgi:hypothetical protein